LNPTSTTPPYYNITTLGNRLYAWRKGLNAVLRTKLMTTEVAVVFI